jgi:hypothetical protein
VTRTNKTNLNVVDVVAVPCSAEELIAESQDKKILHHLLAQIMVNTEDLLFSPIRLKRFLKFSGSLEVSPEWFLDLLGRQHDYGWLWRKIAYNQSCDAPVGVTVLFQVL